MNKQLTSVALLSTSLGLMTLTAGCSGNPVATALSNPFGIPTQVGVPIPGSASGNATSTTSAYRVSDSAPSLAAGIKGNVSVVVNMDAMINTILGAVAKAHLVPGQSYTFPNPNNPAGKLTVLLSVLSDHAVISVGQGTSATGPDQLVGISYSNPKKGIAVFHIKNDPKLGTLYLTENYDVDAGRATIDGAQDTTGLADAKKMLAHWEFTKPAQPGPNGVTFGMQVSAHAVSTADATSSGIIGLSANFLADGSAAAIFGLQTAGTSNQFMLVPSDGVSYTDASAAHDFYMNAQGQDMPKTLASADLKAIVPANDSIYKPFPADPTQGDIFANARFAFPTTVDATAQASGSAKATL